MSSILVRTAVIAAIIATLPPAAGSADWQRLSDGDRVEIECELVGTALVAREIDVRSGRGRRTVEIVAPLREVSPRRLGLAGAMVEVGSDVTFKWESGQPATWDELAPGLWVEVDADITGKRLVARRVKLLGSDERPFEVEGPLDRLEADERRAYVAGIPITMNNKVTVRGLPVYVPRAVDDDDVESTFLQGFAGRLLLGGRVVGSVEPERNFDLNTARPGDLVSSDWSAELQADVRLAEKLDAFGKAAYRGTRILHDDEGDEVDRVDPRLQQAWLLWRPARRLAVQIGRQDFDESREWLYDENLDGVRAHLQTGHVRTELSVSTRWNTEAGSLKDWTNFMVVSGREIRRDWDVETYGIHRRRTADRAAPLWVGLRSHGRLASAVRHWLELSSLTGTLDGVDRQAWAFDAGVRVRLHRSTRASITAGWAVGSGGDGPEGLYRQTGLNDNNDKFSGVSSFRYYGELFEPELANLSVLTLGAGLRPSSQSSVDVVYHDYTQRRPDARIVRSNLESRPRGISPDLGHEWDLIVAFEEIPSVDIEYVLARFLPGDAFDSAAESATFHKLSIQYGF